MIRLYLLCKKCTHWPGSQVSLSYLQTLINTELKMKQMHPLVVLLLLFLGTALIATSLHLLYVGVLIRLLGIYIVKYSDQPFYTYIIRTGNEYFEILA